MKKKIALGLAIGTILSLGGGTYAYAANTPVAYVSVDINPSIELGVNVFDKIVSVEAYNEDGQKVLEGTALVNLEVDKAVSTIISNSVSNGYIKEDDTITDDIDDVDTTTSAAVEITTSTDEEDVADKLNQSLKEAADETLDNNNVGVEVETENVALARRDEARQLGITPGKLNLIQKLQKLDSTIKVEDYKTSSVKDIQRKNKELRKHTNSKESATEDSTSLDVNTDLDTNENIDADIDTVTEENIQEEISSETSLDQEDSTETQAIDSEESIIAETEKNTDSFKNDNIIKEEGNSGSKKEKNNDINKDINIIESHKKENDSEGVKSQSNSNPRNSENSNKNSNSQGNKGNKDRGNNK